MRFKKEEQKKEIEGYEERGRVITKDVLVERRSRKWSSKGREERKERSKKGKKGIRKRR